MVRMMKVGLIIVICHLTLIQSFYLTISHTPSSRKAVVWGFLSLQFVERDNKNSLILEQAAMQQSTDQSLFLQEFDFIKPFSDRKYRFYPELMQSIPFENHEHHMLKLAYASKNSADWQIVIAFSNEEHAKVESIRLFIEQHQKEGDWPLQSIQTDSDWEEESEKKEDM